MTQQIIKSSDQQIRCSCASRTTSDEERSGESAIAAEAFMNNAG